MAAAAIRQSVMRLRQLPWLPLAAVLLLGRAPQPPFAAVAETYRTLSSSRAGFSQVHMADGAVTRWAGRHACQRPGRIRWESTEGQDAGLWSDGEHAVARLEGRSYPMSSVPDEAWPWLYDDLARLEALSPAPCTAHDAALLCVTLSYPQPGVGGWDRGRVELRRDDLGLVRAFFWRGDRAVTWIQFTDFELNPDLPAAAFVLP